MDDAINLVRKSLPQPKGQASIEFKQPTQQEQAALFAERITPETELPPMRPLFDIFGTPCFYRGELVADCGKAKSGKTTFLSALMACATSAHKTLSVERHKDEAEGADAAEVQPLRVLWIDTEQSQQSTQMILKSRILPLIQGEEGRQEPSAEGLNDHFFAFNLRGLGYETRKRMVEVGILTVNPDLVIIDGIKDLMTDINDAVQATLIMEELMALAKAYRCCIVSVLHQNKSEADRNMRGSIGTELTNKAFEVFQCEVIEDHSGDTTFKVTHTYSRNRKMRQRLYYRLDEHNLPVLLADYQEQQRDTQGRFTTSKDVPTLTSDLTVEDPKKLREVFTKAMEGRTQRSFSELMAVALKKCGVVDAKTYYAYCDAAVAHEIIRKVVHPDTGATWVELLDNTLPF